MTDDKKIDWSDRDDEFGHDVGEEDSSDLTISKEDFEDVLVAPADWTIGTLYSQIGDQIDLDPDFQRRNVWNINAKSRFIESLFLGIPIPQILLSARKGSKNSFLVLDGKQRLLTIKEFLDGKLSNGRTFRLRKLRVLPDLDGKSWEDIRNDPTISLDILNETQRTTVLRGWKTENVLYEIFYRLNSGSVKLSPMELRTSLYPGPFLKYAVRWTEQIGPLHHLLRKRTPDPRMADVELAVRHLAMSDDEIVYGGDLKKFLDQTCEIYNKDWNEELEIDISNRLNNMNDAIDAGLKVFSEKAFCRKFVDDQFENRFNRAIFDIQVGAFSNVEFRAWALEHSEEVVDAFKKLSADDNDFIRSIETTTKSKEATKARYAKWFKVVKDLSKIELPLPKVS